MASLSQVRVKGTLYDIKDSVARMAVGAPSVVATASEMVDQSRVYVYTGSESGYTNGNWYYYNGSSWVSGGVYNSAAVETDTSLSVSGAPADAKVTGDSIKNLVAVGDTVTSNYTQILFAENTSEVDLVTSDELNAAIDEVGSGGQPVPVVLASGMVDTEVIYLYLGEETGYTYGHVYAYVNSEWKDTGLYGRGQDGTDGEDGFSPTASVSKSGTTTTITITDENGTTTAQVEDGVAPEAMIADKVADWLDENITEPTGVVIDTSLSVAGAAADAKKTGDEIADLKSAIETAQSVEIYAQGTSLVINTELVNGNEVSY